MSTDGPPAGQSHPAAPPAIGARFLLRLALWLAVAFGLAEAALVAVAAFGLGRFMHVSPQLVWQAALSFALVFLAVAALAMIPWRRLDGARRLRIVAFACVAIGCTSIFMMASQLGRWAPLILSLGVAAQLSHLAVRFHGPLRRVVGATLVPGVLLVAVLGIGLNGAWWLAERRGLRPASAASESPNVLIIVWDTVRAASLSLYGYARETTPHLAALAARSTVFENAFSPAPWTLPSHAALFTGLEPDRLSGDWQRPLGEEAPTLAEVLRDRGYRTGGFVANTYFAGREAGVARGFLRYEDYPLLSLQQLVRSTTLGRRLIRIERFVDAFDYDPSMELKPAHEITDAALSWIERDRDRPFFAFLNYLDAHSPYAPPPPYDRQFGQLERLTKLNFGNGRRLTPAELQAEIDAYDGAIAYLDAELHRLLAELDSLGVLDNTIVVVTSDHGEEFGEHDVYLHGSTLFDRSLHVPLLIHLPGRSSGTRRDEWVTIADVPATILQAIGGAESLPGRGLALAGGVDSSGAGADTILAAVSRRPGVLERYPAAKGRMVSVMVDPWKYIRDGEGAESLFDLRTDRDERHSLVGAAPAGVLEALRGRAGARPGTESR